MPVDVDAAILKELKYMTTMMSSSGNMGTGSELRSRGSVDDEEKAAAARGEKVASKVQKRLLKSSNEATKAAGRYATSLADLRKVNDKNYKFNLKKFVKIKAAFDAHQITQQQAEEQLEDIGRSFGDLSKDIRKELIPEIKATREALGDFEKSLEGAETKSAGLGKAFNAIKILGLAAGKQLYEVATASMRSGVDMTAKGIYQSRLMGMSQVELIETQGRYRNAIEASGVSSDEFSAMMLESSHSLFLYTGSLKEGAVFAAESAQMFRNLGANGMKQSEFMEAQAQSFKNLHSTLSITNDEFKEMNAQMFSSHETRQQLFKMEKSRRAAYFIELTQLREKMMIDGLTKEAALSAIEALQEIGAKDPKSRLKTAAKTQALAGAMGMSQEDASRMAALIRSGARGKGEKEELFELEKDLTRRVQKEQSRTGPDAFRRELMASQLMITTNLEKYGAGGKLAEVILAEDRKVDVKRSKDGKLSTENSVDLTGATLELTIATQQLTHAMTEGPMGALAAVLGGGQLIGALKALGGAKMGGLNAQNVTGKGILDTAKSGKMGVAKVAGGALAVGAAFTGGYAIGTWIEEALMEAKPDMMREIGDSLFSLPGKIFDFLNPFSDGQPSKAEIGKAMVAEMAGNATKEQLELLKEQNELTKMQMRQSADQANQQTDAVNNQTKAGNLGQRKEALSNQNRQGFGPSA